MALVLKETLRLYPPLILIPRLASKACVIDGYHIPSNTIVNLLIQHHHRLSEVWSEPEQFDPERFDDSRREDSILRIPMLLLGEAHIIVWDSPLPRCRFV